MSHDLTSILTDICHGIQLHIFTYIFIYLCFEIWFLLYSSGCLEIHYVDQVWPWTQRLFCPCLLRLGLKRCSSTPSPTYIFHTNYLLFENVIHVNSVSRSYPFLTTSIQFFPWFPLTYFHSSFMSSFFKLCFVFSFFVCFKSLGPGSGCPWMNVWEVIHWGTDSLLSFFHRTVILFFQKTISCQWLLS